MFSPIIDGKPAQSIEFDRVLYVPDLENNLFSMLSAVHRNGLKVIIENHSMSFIRDGICLLTGLIHRNMGMLDGTTLNSSEQAFVTKIS